MYCRASKDLEVDVQDTRITILRVFRLFVASFFSFYRSLSAKTANLILLSLL